MNVTLLPTWANAIFVIAIMLLCALSLSTKKESLKISLKFDINANLKVAYHVFATTAILALTVFFFRVSPLKEIPGLLIGIVCVILFLAFLVACIGGSECDDKKTLLVTTGTVCGICIVFVTLIFTNIANAAIWLAVLIGFAVIEFTLFPSTKKKE